MATILRYPNGQEAYARVVDFVLQSGHKRAPRGIPTRDAGVVMVILDDVHNALPLGTGRKISCRVAAAEAVQLIGGYSDPSLLPASFDAYREASGRFHGAYGERIGQQLPYVVEKLDRDPATRQAIITLWDPFKDNIPEKKDYPCTVMMAFSVDEVGRLVMDTVMRSNDVWLGTPYDWFQFTQLQQTVAALLKRTPGEYRHTALSLHLYERDFDKIANLHPPESTPFQPSGLARPGDYTRTMMERARKVPYELVLGQTASEAWYRENLFW